MVAMTVDELHESVDYERWRPNLEKVAGLWRQLTALEKWARNDQAHFARYKALLTKSIKRAEKNAERAARLSDAEVARLAKEYFQQYHQWCIELGISNERHPGHCERLLPDHYKAVSAALSAFIESCSREDYDALCDVTHKMLKAYAGA